jgi:hypothetical protein
LPEEFGVSRGELPDAARSVAVAPAEAGVAPSQEAAAASFLPDAAGTSSPRDLEASVPAVPEEAGSPTLVETTVPVPSSSAIADAGYSMPPAVTSSDAGVVPLEASVQDEVQDAASVCVLPAAAGSECSLADSCGCSPGFVCRVADQHTGQTLCFDPGVLVPYSACEFDQDCDAASVCEDGLCHPTCSDVNTLCADDSWCGPLREGGRTVCQGHCNVYRYVTGRYGTFEFWVELQGLLHERGMSDLPVWELDYTPCGEGGYCHPGAPGLTPFPYCMRGTGAGLQDEVCQLNTDCADGYGCVNGVCSYWGFVDNNCPNDLDCSYDGTDPLWRSPDGYNVVGVCITTL